MIYLIPIVLILMGVVLFDMHECPSWRGVWIFLCWLSLVLIAGFRYQVGGDTLNYMDDFKDIAPLKYLSYRAIANSPYNILWVLLNSTCKSIYNHFVVVQLVHAVFVNSAIFYFFSHHTKRIFTALFFYSVLYFFFYNTEIMRASLAMAVFLFGYSTLEKKQWLRYLLVTIVAFGFHSEAIIMLLFPICYWLGRMTINLRNVTILLIASLALMSLMVFLPSLTSLFGSSDKLANVAIYIKTNDELNLMGKLRFLLLIIPWLGVLFLCQNSQDTLSKGFLVLLILLSVPMMENHVLFSRLTDFIKPICIVCLANGLKEYYSGHTESLRVVKILTIAFLLLLVPNEMLMGGQGKEVYKRYVPYYSYFERKTSNDVTRQQIVSFQLKKSGIEQ